MPTDAPTKTGQTVTIGVDADGNPVHPRPSSRENTTVAAAAAIGIWALAAGTVLLPTALARTLIRRNRLQHWAHEWKQRNTPPR